MLNVTTSPKRHPNHPFFGNVVSNCAGMLFRDTYRCFAVIDTRAQPNNTLKLIPNTALTCQKPLTLSKTNNSGHWLRSLEKFKIFTATGKTSWMIILGVECREKNG